MAHLSDTQITGLYTWTLQAPADRAAVELLLHHGQWLDRADFRQEFLQDIPADPVHTRALTLIHWDLVHTALRNGDLPACPSAVAVLRIALSLATREPVDLDTALTELDTVGAAAVASAVLTAADTPIPLWPEPHHAPGGRTALYLDPDGRFWAVPRELLEAAYEPERRPS